MSHPRFLKRHNTRAIGTALLAGALALTAASLPTLTLALPGGTTATLVNGAASVSGLTVLPATVTVRSSAGGISSKPLTVINP